MVINLSLQPAGLQADNAQEGRNTDQEQEVGRRKGQEKEQRLGGRDSGVGLLQESPGGHRGKVPRVHHCRDVLRWLRQLRTGDGTVHVGLFHAPRGCGRGLLRFVVQPHSNHRRLVASFVPDRDVFGRDQSGFNGRRCSHCLRKRETCNRIKDMEKKKKQEAQPYIQQAVMYR